MEPDNSYILMKQADEFLKNKGYTIWGRKKKDSYYQQTRFEARMQTGAYSRNSENRRK